MKAPSVLMLVDDDSDAVLSLARTLSSRGGDFRIVAATTEEQALELQLKECPAVAILDLSLNEIEGPSSGLRLLRQLVQNDPFLRVIVLTGHGSIEYGVKSIQAGASSFLQKPADLTHLEALIKDAQSQNELRRELSRLRTKELMIHGLVGASESLVKLREEISFCGFSPQPVLLLGETGCGKSLVARLIHDSSPRAKYKFIRYQPTQSSSDLVASDLFGHKKGAFTGAHEDRKGLIAEANKGTLFLDEIDEFPQSTQVSLLGILQDQRYRVVGESTEQKSDVRIIAASNTKITEAVEGGKLRKDLFHRISHIKINIAPLRERKLDIEPLSNFFIQQQSTNEEIGVGGISASAIQKLHSYDWPGNVRELEAVVVASCYRAQFRGGFEIEPSDILLNASTEWDGAEALTLHDKVLAFKKNLVLSAMQQSNGNQVRAAKLLGIDRTSLRRLLNLRQ